MRSSSICDVLPLILTYLITRLGAKYNQIRLVVAVRSLLPVYDEFGAEFEAI